MTGPPSSSNRTTREASEPNRIGRNAPSAAAGTDRSGEACTDGSTATKPEAVLRNKGRDDTDWVTVPSPLSRTSENVDSPTGLNDTGGGVGIGAGNATGGTNTEGTAGAGPGAGRVDTAAGTGPEPGKPGNGNNGEPGTRPPGAAGSSGAAPTGKATATWPTSDAARTDNANLATGRRRQPSPPERPRLIDPTAATRPSRRTTETQRIFGTPPDSAHELATRPQAKGTSHTSPPQPAPYPHTLTRNPPTVKHNQPNRPNKTRMLIIGAEQSSPSG